MENPAYWTRVEHLINESLVKDAEDRANGVIGWSTAMKIANALRAEGLLKEED